MNSPARSRETMTETASVCDALGENHTHTHPHNVSVSGEMVLHFKLIIRECLLRQRAFSSHGDLKVKETIYELKFHPSSAQADNVGMKVTLDRKNS